MKVKNLIKKADVFIIVAVFLLTALLFFISSREKAATALLIVDGETIYRTDISKVQEPFTIELENGITVQVAKNEISVLSSDCYGKNCISCGKLTNPGDTAVCIPNKTVIKLTGTDKNAPDAVSY